MAKSNLPQETAEQRMKHIGDFCRRKGPHISFGGKITVGKAIKEPPDAKDGAPIMWED